MEHLLLFGITLIEWALFIDIAAGALMILWLLLAGLGRIFKKLSEHSTMILEFYFLLWPYEAPVRFILWGRSIRGI